MVDARFGPGRPRPPMLGDAEARQAWRDLIDRAVAVANAVRGGVAIHRDERAIFAGLVIRPRAPFPLRHASAQNAAEAFLVLARGFVASGFPAETAAFLASGATCLDAMLVADGHARAAAGRRLLGEED